jgi:hypothetical protein
MTKYQMTDAEQRNANWENFKWVKKNVYRPRLERVIEGLAWFNGHEVATHDDVMEAQRIMDREYLSLFAF